MIVITSEVVKVSIQNVYLKCKAINTTCNDTSLKSTNSVKFLGIVIDSVLKWNTHNDLLIKKSYMHVK